MVVEKTKLKDHKRDGKKLIPPLNTFPFKKTQWTNNRLPEMLWAALIIGNLDRDKALVFFRFVGSIKYNEEYILDNSLTGIASMDIEKKKFFIEKIINYSTDTKNILQALIVFESLPAREIWKEYLDTTILYNESKSVEIGQILYNAVLKCYNHQSQETTDCRWVRILPIILSGKIKFLNTINNIEDNVQGIINYPNSGELTSIRPWIRNIENMCQSVNSKGEEIEENTLWAEKFWEEAFNKSPCIYSEIDIEKEKKTEKDRDIYRIYYAKKAINIREKLVEHYIGLEKGSFPDPKFQSFFGLCFYGIVLFIELFSYRIDKSITSRLIMRALVESYITLAYLVSEGDSWYTYRNYGSGKLKQIILKLEELNISSKMININYLNILANWDGWTEFLDINLGHWDESNLRAMSDKSGTKDLYDKYFDYTSGFVHGNWGSVRESIFENCNNPLHRFHLIHKRLLFDLDSVEKDSVEILNKYLDLLDKEFPKFDFRIDIYEQEK